MYVCVERTGFMFSKTISLVMSVCMLITSAPLGGVLEEIGNLIDNFGQKIADSADNLGQNGEDTSATTEEKDFVVSENAVDTWDGKTSTPTLSGSIYAINTAEELAWVASQYSNKFKGYTIQLNNDIDLAGHNWERIGGHSSVGSTSATYYFDGTFDGQGHTISNMTITETNYGRTGYVGLFGYIGENAVVKNKKGQKIKYKINRKPSSIKKLSKSGQYAAKKAEHKKSSVRAKVEHVFAVVKRLFGYRKTRYRGLRKQTAKLNIMFALANLYLADRKFLTA